jgi:hypothetical protein
VAKLGWFPPAACCVSGVSQVAGSAASLLGIILTDRLRGAASEADLACRSLAVIGNTAAGKWRSPIPPPTAFTPF